MERALHLGARAALACHVATLPPQPGGLQLSERGKFNFYKINNYNGLKTIKYIQIHELTVTFFHSHL